MQLIFFKFVKKKKLRIKFSKKQESKTFSKQLETLIKMKLEYIAESTTESNDFTLIKRLGT